MAYTIQRVEYYYATVQDRPGEAYRLLTDLASWGVNLLAFNAVPAGDKHTHLALFPEDSDPLVRSAKRTGLALTGPHHAFLIRGDDELGALAHIHRRLYQANVNVYASSGISDGHGGYGYVVYVRAEDVKSAAAALEL